MAPPKKHRPPHGCRFVRSTVELLQGFALHPQLHLGILLEDLRVASGKQLRYPFVGYASCAQPCGIGRAQVVSPKIGNRCPSQSFRPNGLSSVQVSLSLRAGVPCVVIRIVFIFRAVVGDALNHDFGIVAASERTLRVRPIVFGLALVVGWHRLVSFLTVERTETFDFLLISVSFCVGASIRLCSL
jgi:hypothetical protein